MTRPSLRPLNISSVFCRLSFRYDFSGSLWYEREGRPARKLAVDRRLRELLPRLPPDTRFNVVPYTERPHPWSKRLVDTTGTNVRRALTWFERAAARCEEREGGERCDGPAENHDLSWFEGGSRSCSDGPAQNARIQG